jgi:NAD(P)-dependent dehydrogenase (short-subunit alcohol dehydrogenase family)
LRDLNGKVVIITGATAGIGAAAARALVEKGCKVVLNARSEERLKGMVAELGANAIYVAGDSSDPDITVYGVTHTSTTPLATIGAQRNVSTNLVEITASTTQTNANNDLKIRLYAIELPKTV